MTATVQEITGSLQTGLIVLSLLTSVGVIAGLLYPTRLPGTRDAAKVSDADGELERSR